MYSNHHHQKYNMDCIQDMEKAEEILRQKWNEVKGQKCRAKSIIAKLFELLKDRQTTTSAAYQALDKYDALKHERKELAKRDKVLFEEYNRWLSSERDGEEHIEEELESVMELYEEVAELTQKILNEWRECKRSDAKVGAELETLNSRLADLPAKLVESNILEFGNYRWPAKQTKKVSNAVENSFDQMDYIRGLMEELSEKQQLLESVFSQRKKNTQLSSSSCYPSSSFPSSSRSWRK